MKIRKNIAFYFSLLTLLCTSFTATKNKAVIHENLLTSRYDSSYDFNEIDKCCENPKDLIGQELIFAPRSISHKIGTEVSRLNRLSDSIFIGFSTKNKIPLSGIIKNTSNDTAAFVIVDGSRFPKHYKTQSEIKQNLTTNTYKPTALLTDNYPFGSGTEKAILVGTAYSKLAGRSFKIKDVTCIYDYYNSRTAYFYQLIDDENNEVSFFYFYDNALSSIVHIKGYLDNIKLNHVNKTLTLKKYQERNNDSTIFLGQVFVNGQKEELIPSAINFTQNTAVKCIGFQFISLDTYYFQLPAYEILDNRGNKIIVECGLIKPFIYAIK